MIDAHFHAWQLARGDYGWLTPELAPIYRDVQVSDWQTHARDWGIAGGVLVQAAPTAEETAYLLQQAQRHPEVLGVVGWIDMLAADALAQVAHCAALPLLKGLRPMLQDLDDPDWILQPAIQPVLAAMARHGLVFDALIQPVHLPRMLALTQAHPDLTVVVDHGAKPVIDPQALPHWAQAMAQLARQSDPQLQAAESRSLAQGEGVVQSRAALLPQLDGISLVKRLRAARRPIAVRASRRPRSAPPSSSRRGRRRQGRARRLRASRTCGPTRRRFRLADRRRQALRPREGRPLQDQQEARP